MNNTYQKNLLKALLQFLKDTEKEMKEKGFVPTLELAIEELEEKLADEFDEETNLN